MPDYKYQKNSKTVFWSNGRTRGFGLKDKNLNLFYKFIIFIIKLQNSMAYKHSLLFESEKNHIREMYGLLTEQRFVPGKGGSVDIPCLYGPGYYSLKHTDKSGTAFDNEISLNPVIDEAAEFLKNNVGWIPKITITSGESIIPNYDSEGGTGKKPVGWLSTARKNKIEAYVNLKLKTLKVSKPAKVVLLFQEAKTLVLPSGGWPDYVKWRKSTPEEKNVNPKNREYTNLKQGYDKDQFTKITFTVIPDLGPYQCTFNVKIGVHYDNKQIGHTCDDARYQILANGIPLTTSQGTSCGTGLSYADMNNGGGQLDCKGTKDRGGLRFNYFKLDNKALIDKIMAADTTKQGYIRLTTKCIPNTINNTKGGGCHTDVPHITVNDTDGKLTVDTYPKANDAYLVTLDKCGKLVSGGGGVVKVSNDVKGKSAETKKPVGRKLAYATSETGTLTSEQGIQNLLSKGLISQNSDKTYTVLKSFGISPNTYLENDIINKILPKGSKITFPS